MAQGYVYDPSQQISQSFQQAGQSIGNIFTNIVQQKQRDYTLAENAFNNIEALKKNLNIYGQKNITDKSNALLKEASSAIFADGKIDYSKLGEIRQKVSDINDLKQGYDLGAKEFERMVQLGVANKDNLVSFEKFYKEMSAKMGDENLIKNPQDLQRQMSEVYTNNLDANKMFMKTFLAANPMQKISKTVDVLDAKGKVIGKNFIQAEVPAGITFDAKGNKIVDPNLASNTVAYLQQSNPELLALMKKNAGVAGDMLSDEQLVSRYINNVPTAIMAKEEKSDAQLRAEKAQADLAEFKAENAPNEWNLEKAKAAASIRSSESSARYYDTQADLLKSQSSGGGIYSDKLYDAQDKKNVNYNAVPLNSETPTAIRLVNGVNKSAIVSDVAVGDNGQIYAKVGVHTIQGSPEKRIVNDKKNINDYEFHKIDPKYVPSFLRDMKIAANKSGDSNTRKAALANIRSIENTYNQIKQTQKAKPAAKVNTIKNINAWSGLSDDEVKLMQPKSGIQSEMSPDEYVIFVRGIKQK